MADIESNPSAAAIKDRRDAALEGSINSPIPPSMNLDATNPNSGDNTLSWCGVQMTVKTKEAAKTILSQVWGEARPFETTAIMGASGAGKTSLFNILAARLVKSHNVTIEGDIRVGGTQITDKNIAEMRQKFAFVGQDDCLHATSTPREAIRFSARLRLPRTVTNEQIDQLVQDNLQDLGLVKCADTQIGGLLVKGISGGEKRRTSVGIELVTKPSIILLDEPTSGLDSHAAAALMELLKNVAIKGNTVLFTVHQPASKIFFSFDKVILLNAGRLMHLGKTSEIPADFSRMQCPVPDNTNPADWILEVAQDKPIQELESHGFFPTGNRVPKKLLLSDVLDMSTALLVAKAVHGQPSPSSSSSVGRPASMLTQATLLFRREWTNFMRNATLVLGGIAMGCIMITIAGTLFYGIGTKDRSDLSVINGVFGAMINTMVLTMMIPAGMIVAWYASERPLFVKEYQTRTYSVLPYLLSKMLFDTIQTTCISFSISVISYFMADFRMNFGIWLGINIELSYTMTAMATAFGVSFTDMQLASLGLNLISLPQFYFSGLLVPISAIPTWIVWAQYLCAMRYGSGLALLYEFNECTAAEQANCLQQQQFQSVDESIWWFWIANAALIVVFRIVSYILMSRSLYK